MTDNENNKMILAGLEAGGTKLVCAVGYAPGEKILAREQFATGSDPAAAIVKVNEWFRQQERRHGRLAGLGIASFGPLCLDESSESYGFITNTPKPGWRNSNLLGLVKEGFPELPLAIDTDVNGAALAESLWGAAQGLSDFVYITMGTGVGGGAMAGGRLVHGLLHPEMGHMMLSRLPGDNFPGTCPFHKACWEGLCAGPAIKARTGRAAQELSADDPAWDLVIRYTAQALANLSLVLSPQRIVLGGSVRKAGKLGEAEFFRRLRIALLEVLSGYLEHPMFTETGVDGFVVPPILQDDAGVCGALALAGQAMDNKNNDS